MPLRVLDLGPKRIAPPLPRTTPAALMFLGSPGVVDWYRDPCARVAVKAARIAPLGLPRDTTAELLLCGAPPPEFDAERFFRGRRRYASPAALGLFLGHASSSHSMVAVGEYWLPPPLEPGHRFRSSSTYDVTFALPRK